MLRRLGASGLIIVLALAATGCARGIGTLSAGRASASTSVASVAASSASTSSEISTSPPNVTDAVTVGSSERWGIASGSLWERTTGGSRWRSVLNTPSCSIKAVAFPSASDGWVGGSGPSGFCVDRTIDTGATWTALNASVFQPAFQAFAGTMIHITSTEVRQQCSVTALHFASTDTGWILSQCVGDIGPGEMILQTVDAGQAWTLYWSIGDGCLMLCYAALDATVGGIPWPPPQVQTTARKGVTTITIHQGTPTSPTSPLWAAAIGTPERTVVANPMPSGYAASFRALWNDQNLYLLNQVSEPGGIHPFVEASAGSAGFAKNGADDPDTDPVGYNDGMDIYLAPHNAGLAAVNETPVHLAIPAADPQRVWSASGTVPAGVAASISATSSGYDLMVTIPWKALGIVPSVGLYVGVEVGASAYSHQTEEQVVAYPLLGWLTSWGQMKLSE